MPRYPYSFDRVANMYDATRVLPPEAEARFVEALSSLGVGGRILEVGVGTGRLAVPLQKAGYALIGTDVSREMVGIGRRKGLQGVVLADAAQLPFAAASFEVAMTNHVLHLLKGWKAAIREICRVTRGRYLTVMERETEVPDLTSAYHKFVVARGESTSRPGIHERDLPAMIPPTQLVALGTFHPTQEAAQAIDILAARSMSSQWFVSETAHTDAIRSVRAEFAGQTIVTDIEISMAIWDIERLAPLTEAQGGVEDGAHPDRTC